MRRKKKRASTLRKGKLRRLFLLAALLLAAGGAWQVLAWPAVEEVATRNPKTTAFIEQYKKERMKTGRGPPLSWKWVPYGSISPSLKQAVLVGEDIRFFVHNGFDYGEIQNSLKETLQDGEPPRGASTITQQLAKNLWLSPSRNPVRKIKEAILTYQLEKHLRKRRILEIYLNVVEFGRGIYGAEAAALHYFGKHASALDTHESALLAASLPRPSSWNPQSRSTYYRKHVQRITRRMSRATFLLSYI
ncbi:MAG: monofunctional biosynthetic peptidoglycan transglycosylase [bacterium]